jgi:type I restriction enzyme S subunit
MTTIEISGQSVEEGFKHTEIGMLPEEWDVVRLGNVASIRGGQAFPHKYQGQVSGEYPFFKVSDMNLPGNEVRMNRANNFIDDPVMLALKAKPFPPHTVIFPKVGGAIHTNKKTRVAKLTGAMELR